MLSRALVRATRFSVPQSFESFLIQVRNRRGFGSQFPVRVQRNVLAVALQRLGVPLRLYATQPSKEAPHTTSTGPNDSKTTTQETQKTDASKVDPKSSPTADKASQTKEPVNGPTAPQAGNTTKKEKAEQKQKTQKTQKTAKAGSTFDADDLFDEGPAQIGMSGYRMVDYKAMRTKKSFLAHLGNGLFFLFTIGFVGGYILYKCGVSDKNNGILLLIVNSFPECCLCSPEES